MKIAIYRSEHTDIIAEADTWIGGSASYVRVSEIVDVEFTMLPKSETQAKELALIDAQIEELQANYGSKISHLQAKRQELLAIGHDDE